jgi:FAD/FMN-containing dehydrogenase
MRLRSAVAAVGEDGVLRIAAWVARGTHPRASFLRKNGHDNPDTYLRPSHLGEYLDLATAATEPTQATQPAQRTQTSPLNSHTQYLYAQYLYDLLHDNNPSALQQADLDTAYAYAHEHGLPLRVYPDSAWSSWGLRRPDHKVIPLTAAR